MEKHDVELVFEDTADDTRIYECNTCWTLWDITDPRKDDDDVCPNEEEEVASGSGAASAPAGSSGETRERESFTWGSGYR